MQTSDNLGVSLTLKYTHVIFHNPDGCSCIQKCKSIIITGLMRQIGTYCSQMMSDSTYLLSLASQPYFFPVRRGKRGRGGKNTFGQTRQVFRDLCRNVNRTNQIAGTAKIAFLSLSPDMWIGQCRLRRLSLLGKRRPHALHWRSAAAVSR